MLLHRFQNRVSHHLVDLVSELSDASFVLAKTRATFVEILPLVHILLDLLVTFLDLFFFEFGLKVIPFISEVSRLVECDLVFAETVKNPLVHLTLLISVLLRPFSWGLLGLLFSRSLSFSLFLLLGLVLFCSLGVFLLLAALLVLLFLALATLRSLFNFLSLHRGTGGWGWSLGDCDGLRDNFLGSRGCRLVLVAVLVFAHFL